MKPIIQKINYRVLYADTDAMGVMYYANYLRLYEAGRGDFLRKLGFTYQKMYDEGIVCPALNVNIDYIKFAKFDSILSVVTKVEKKPIVKLEFIQEIYDEDNELLNRAIVNLGFVNTKTNKATRCPLWFLELFDENTKKC